MKIETYIRDCPLAIKTKFEKWLSEHNKYVLTLAMDMQEVLLCIRGEDFITKDKKPYHKLYWTNVRIEKYPFFNLLSEYAIIEALTRTKGYGNRFMGRL